MAMLGMLLMLVGAIISLIFGVIILIKAFQTSILWGLGSLFIPFVVLVFVAMHWADTQKPFLYAVGGWVLMLVGGLLGGGPSSFTTI
jgi:hypothetical protein